MRGSAGGVQFVAHQDPSALASVAVMGEVNEPALLVPDVLSANHNVRSLMHRGSPPDRNVIDDEERLA
jgi:hypothetical protein